MKVKQAVKTIKRARRIGRGIGRGIRRTLLVSFLGIGLMANMDMQYAMSAMQQPFQEMKETTSEIGTEISKELMESLAGIFSGIHKDSDPAELAETVTNWANELAADNEFLGEFQRADIVRVVDGDTIVVNIEGDQCKVRLIGVNTPESVASEEYLEKTGKENTQEGKEASQFTKELLSNYETVYLESDQGDTDTYGRILRYVWLEEPIEISQEEIESKMLQGILLDNGVAETMEIQPNTKYADIFADIEEEFQER